MTDSIRIDETLGSAGGFYLNAKERLDSYKTQFQDVEVYDTTRFGKLFRLDGFFMTSEKDEFFYHENMIHVPLMAQLQGPRRALIIGGGDGGSAEELLKYPSMEKIVLVELDGEVVDIARRYLASIHHHAFDDPKVEVRIEDGLKYVREVAPAQPEKFDLIVLDLTDPIGPAEALYTAEFFADCKKLLSDQGALSLHIGSPIFNPEVPQKLLKRLRGVFKEVTPYFVYVPLYGTLWGMACASDQMNPKTLTVEAVESLLKERQINDLQYLNGETFRALFALPNYLRVLLAP